MGSSILADDLHVAEYAFQIAPPGPSDELPTMQELLVEPDGIDDLSPYVREEAQYALATIASNLGCSAAAVGWRDSAGRTRPFASSSPEACFDAAALRAFFDRPPHERFHFDCQGESMTCTSLPVPAVTGDFRLCLFQAPADLPAGQVDWAVATVRLSVHMVRSARHMTRLRDRASSFSLVSDMLTTLLEARSVEDILGALAEKIAKATNSEAVSIDSFDAATERFERNLYADPSWPDAQEGARRWRELLAVRVESLRRGRVGTEELRLWRDTLVIPDAQHPAFLATLPPEEAEFLAEVELRTVLMEPLWVADEFVGILCVSNRQVRRYSRANREALSRMAKVAAVAIRGAQLMQDLGESHARERVAYMENIALLAAAAEARDMTTGRHLENLQTSVQLLCEALGQTPEFARDLAQASRMHDIGKISVPDAILLKPGPLTFDEREIIKLHTVDGERLLSGPRLKLAREVARWHHERWDGNGYPDGLGGLEIPLGARIIAVADVYDALISARPYKEPWEPERAIAEIMANAGTQFEGHIVAVFHDLWRAGRIGGQDEAA